MPTFSTVNHALQFGTNPPTVSIYGTDASGYITYQTSGSFLSFENNTEYFVLQVIFDTAYIAAPFSVTLTPANSATEQALTSQPSVVFYVNGGDYPGATNSNIKTTYFKITATSSTNALLGPQTYSWHYQVNANKMPSLDTTQSLSVTNSGTSVIGNFFVDGYQIDPSGALVNEVLQYNGTKFVPAVVSGGGSGASIGGAVTGGTAKSVLFVDASLHLAQDNANLNYDFTNHRLGVATAVPGFPLDVTGSVQTSSRFIMIGSSAGLSPIGKGSLRFNSSTQHLEYSENGGAYVQFGASGGVTSVATDATLTGGPITATGTLGIDLTHANTWTGKQTFNNHIAIDGYTLDLSTGAAANQVLQYNGTSFAPATKTIFIGEFISSSTSGSVLFANSTGNLSQDNANFNWDGTSHRLGINRTATNYALEVAGDGYATSRVIINNSSAAVSPSGTGAIRFNTSTNHFEISENGAAYAQVSSGGGTIAGSIAVNQIAYGSGTNAIQGLSGFTFDGTQLTAPVIAHTAGGSNRLDVSGANNNLNIGTVNAQQIVMGGGTFSNGVQIKTFLDMQTHRINNVVDPVGAQDAATKNYVDTHSGASTFAAVYNGGSSASDATALIQASHGGPLVIKGNSAGLGSLFQVKASDNTAILNIIDNDAVTFISKGVGTAQFLLNASVLTDGSYWAFGNNGNTYDAMRLSHNSSNLPPHTVFGASLRFGDNASSGTLQVGTGLYVYNSAQGNASYSTGLVVDTATGWSDPGSRLLSLRTGSGAITGVGASERFGFSGDGGMQINGSTAGVSDANTGRIRYNSGTNHFEISENTGSYLQVLAGAVPIVYEVNFHTADWAKNAAQVGLAASAYTCAVWFDLAKAGHITGARWYQPVGFTANVTVKLWDDSDTLLKTVTITPTPGAINTATFGTSYAHIPSNIRLYLSVYDGVNAILRNDSLNKPGSYASGASTVPGGLWGPEIWQHGHGFAVGDSSPNTADERIIGIEPLYTIP